MRRRFLSGLLLAVMVLPTFAEARDVRRPRVPNRPRVTPRNDGGGGCTDPIEGVWVSRRYRTDFQRWDLFTLTIRRTAPGAETLTGTIEMRNWHGPFAQTTPACTGDYPRDITWDQSARGTLSGDRFTFDGTSVRVRELRCGVLTTYHLDHFEGTLDAARHVITTTNDDHFTEVGVPHEFTRVRCL